MRFLVKRLKDTVEVLLLKNKDGSGYQYINLTKEHICPCKFETVTKAIKDMENLQKEGKIISYEEIVS